MKKIFLGLAAAAAIFAAVSCGGGSKKAKFHYLKETGTDTKKIEVVTEEFDVKDGKLQQGGEDKNAPAPAATAFTLTAETTINGTKYAKDKKVVLDGTDWYKEEKCTNKWVLTDGKYEKGNYWAKYKEQGATVTLSGNKLEGPVGTGATTDITITLTDDTFIAAAKTALAENADAKGLFTAPVVDGTKITATVKTAATDTVVVVTLTATATAEACDLTKVAVKIPAASLTGGKDLTCESETVTYMVTSTATATVGDNTVTGTKGTSLASAADVVLTLTGGKFKALAKDLDVSGWFTNLPAGLEAKVKTAVAADAIEVTVSISGTPTAASSDTMEITIPAKDVLGHVGAVDIDVTENTSAKFAITG